MLRSNSVIKSKSGKSDLIPLLRHSQKTWESSLFAMEWHDYYLKTLRVIEEFLDFFRIFRIFVISVELFMLFCLGLPQGYLQATFFNPSCPLQVWKHVPTLPRRFTAHANLCPHVSSRVLGEPTGHGSKIGHARTPLLPWSLKMFFTNNCNFTKENSVTSLYRMRVEK